MQLIETEITIPAQPDRIWAILTDFDDYENWNPFMVKGRGRASASEHLELTIRTRNGKAMVIKPKVTIVEAQRHLQWLGRLIVPGLFDGRHEFLLAPTVSGTRIVHREIFTGILPALMGSQLKFVEEGFNDFNAALCRRVCS